MSFYQLLFSRKINGINRNLTWYWNLFAKYMRENVGTLLAKILKIKGNTIVWNQLVRNGNFATSSNWGGQSGTVSISNSVCSFTLSANAGYVALRQSESAVQTATVGHKYLAIAELKSPKDTNAAFWLCGKFNSGGQPSVRANTRTRVSAIINYDTSSSNYGFNVYPNITTKLATNDVVEFYYVMLIDLTEMFGSGNEPTIADFEALFPLSYYAYDSGSLLSFNGSGIKTTGKNQLAKPFIYNSNSLTYADGFHILKGNYTFSFGEIVGATSWRFNVKMWDLNGTEITDDTLSPDSTLYYNNNFKGYLSRVNVTVKSIALNITQDCFIRICFALGDTSSSMVSTDAQLEFGSATSYEPYTESTLSLPISTYFPTGMKSAGTVYDELASAKAITRIGAVDLGSLTWYYSNDLFIARISDGAYTGSSLGSANGLCSLYEAKAVKPTSLADKQITLGTAYAFANVGNAVFKDSSYTSASDFKTAMSGVYLYYELATPTEVSIDPPLDLSYEIEWGGTEQLLPENTSTPTTSPISATVEYPDGEHEDYYTYQENEKNHLRLNRALSIMLGRSVLIENPQEPLNIIMRGE